MTEEGKEEAATSPDEALVSVEFLAQVFDGYSARRLQQLTKEGVLIKSRRGLYPFHENTRLFVRYLTQRLAGAQFDGPSERARLSRELADKAALENAERRGNLYSVAVLEQELAKLFSEIRSRMLTLPTKVAPLMSDAAVDNQKVLLEEVNEILESISRFTFAGGSRELPASDTATADNDSAASEVIAKPVGRRKKKVKQRKQRRARKVANG